MKQDIVFILSIDGGGIKGLIPALILKELEKRLNKRGEARPFHKLFDLIAGTSAGGLIALSLAVPLYGKDNNSIYSGYGGVKPSVLPCLYENLSRKIFTDKKCNFMQSIKMAYTAKYSSQPVKKVLEEILKDKTVRNGLTNLLITTFDIKSMQPFFIKNRPGYRGGRNDSDFYMKDAARATSAVPVYFPPVFVNSISSTNSSNSHKYCLIDGGVFCINPSLCAYIEARKIFPYASKYVILSLGTGPGSKSINPCQAAKWGYVGWASPRNGIPLLSTMFEGQKRSAQYMLDKLSDTIQFRLDLPLDPYERSMDDASNKNIKHLKKQADQVIKKYDKELDALCDMIINKKKSVRGKQYV